jgi:hypothetical protein
MGKNLFKEYGKQYISKGLSLIPDRYASKKAMIKDYSRFCYELPKSHDIAAWSEGYKETNIALCLGEASGIIALDVDTEDQRILDEILPLLPSSPVEKKGAKGFTRFFRYKGEATQLVKFNGEVVLEILSSNKKTTLPPSRHPNGCDYVWTTDKGLVDIDKESLPLLPPFLVANIESHLRTRFPDMVSDGKGKMTSGRNSALGALCGELIRDKVPVDEAIKELIKHDKEQHEVPLFSDPNEMRHTEQFTNALQFYTNHLGTVNSRHYRKGEEYEIPITASAVNHTAAEAATKGKSQRQESQKSSKKKESLPVLIAKTTCPCCNHKRTTVND